MFVKGLLVFAALVACSQAAVELTVFYESLCPDSIRFIRNQLYPTWQALGSEYMTVDFVPYGKATHTQDTDGTWSYTCQHGPDECEGNRHQACALNTFGGDQTKSVEYVHCAMTSSFPPSSGPTCAAAVGTTNYAPIQACYDGALGDTLIVANGDRTHAFKPKITFIPTIAFNGVYTSADQSGALSDLLAVVCDKITGTKPSACAGKTNAY